MRPTITLLLVLFLTTGAGCGQGVGVDVAGEQFGEPGNEPSRGDPVAAPTGGFGPLQVTLHREKARFVLPAGGTNADSAASGNCWSAPTLVEYDLATRDRRKPSWVAAAPDGSVWFSDHGDDSIGRLEPSGAVIRYPLPVGRTPGSIAVAADGSVWVATTGPAIVHLTPSGQLVGYAVPPPDVAPMWGVVSGPTALTAGPDGAVWFVDMDGDLVGRIDVEGHVSQYALPSGQRMHIHPEGLAAGSDGAMWFSEILGMRMGRIDVRSFTITEYPVPPIPAGGVPPAAVTAGPDGALWFDGPMGSALGRMTTDGAFRSYQLPQEGRYVPTSATAGPDRRIWTVDTRNGKVLRTTLDGATSEAPPVSDPKALQEGGLRQLSAGPDAVWVAEASLGRIGRYACKTAT